MKSHTGYGLVPKLVTLNDPERHNDAISVVAELLVGEAIGNAGSKAKLAPYYCLIQLGPNMN